MGVCITKNRWERSEGLMKSVFVHDIIREHLLSQKGIVTTKKKVMPGLESLKITEWDDYFESLMRNRLVLSSFRYGLIEDAKAYDYVTSMRQRLDLFDAKGNGEHLVDIANISMVVFKKKMHPQFYFSAQDDGIHALEK